MVPVVMKREQLAFFS